MIQQWRRLQISTRLIPSRPPFWSKNTKGRVVEHEGGNFFTTYPDKHLALLGQARSRSVPAAGPPRSPRRYNRPVGLRWSRVPSTPRGVEQRLDLANAAPEARVLVQPNDHALVRAVRVQGPSAGFRAANAGGHRRPTASAAQPAVRRRAVHWRAFLSALGLALCTRGP